jgi:hypothetical protein
VKKSKSNEKNSTKIWKIEREKVMKDMKNGKKKMMNTEKVPIREIWKIPKNEPLTM